MNEPKSVTPERPTQQDRDPPPDPSAVFDHLYRYAPGVEGYTRRHVPAEYVQDVLSEFWGLRVWPSIQKPGGFELRGEAQTSGWLYKILKRTISDHYRKQSKIERLIAASLDDESNAQRIEASILKAQQDQDDSTDRYQRELIAEIAEQCLGCEEQKEYARRMEGKKLPAEQSEKSYKVWFRAKAKILKALGKAQ